jgi:hypothetical protein
MSDGTSAGVSSRAARILLVTAALSAVGAVVGAITSVVAMTLWLLTHGLGTPPIFSFETGIAAMIGAGLGAVLAPLEAWLLLRRVPLWRAITETAIGTIIGAVAFSFLTASSLIAGAVVGFTVAALRLRFVTRVRRGAIGTAAASHQLEGDDPD